MEHLSDTAQFKSFLIDASEYVEEMQAIYASNPDLINTPFSRLKIVREKEYEVVLFLTDSHWDKNRLKHWDDISAANLQAYQNEAEQRGYQFFPILVKEKYVLVLYPMA